MKKILASALCLFIINYVILYAEVPAGYYNSLEGKSGNTLFSELTTISGVGYNGLGYSGLWTAYKKTDLKANGKIWDMYGDCNFTYSSDQCGSYSSECDCYNREHSLPKSWFGGSTGNAPGTDIVHIVPTDGKVNGMRSNYPFGEVATATYTYGNNKLGSSSMSSYSGIVFEPSNEYKGDFARGYMYMCVRYAGTYELTNENGNSTFNNTFTKAGHYGLTNYGVELLMKWHRNDPVSAKEINRNNAIQETQGNRNPFIDHPELAEYLWGKHVGTAYSLTGEGGEEQEDECADITYTASFTSSMEDFTTYSASGEQTWKTTTLYGMSMSGYVNTQNNANEDWLISPSFNLMERKNATLSFEHTLNFAQNSSIAEQFTLWVSTNYKENVNTATWAQINIPIYPNGNDWIFVSSGEINIPMQYWTENVHFAFKYISTTDEAATWEIKNVVFQSACSEKTSTACHTEPLIPFTIHNRTLQGTQTMYVFNPMGQQIASGMNITLPKAGIYIVRINHNCRKIVIQ